ncbi:MAG: hypothetical protein WD557_11880 [Dehalococcoidia bacterium]
MTTATSADSTRPPAPLPTIDAKGEAHDHLTTIFPDSLPPEEFIRLLGPGKTVSRSLRTPAGAAALAIRQRATKAFALAPFTYTAPAPREPGLLDGCLRAWGYAVQIPYGPGETHPTAEDLLAAVKNNPLGLKFGLIIDDGAHIYPHVLLDGPGVDPCEWLPLIEGLASTFPTAKGPQQLAVPIAGTRGPTERVVRVRSASGTRYSPMELWERFPDAFERAREAREERDASVAKLLRDPDQAWLMYRVGVSARNSDGEGWREHFHVARQLLQLGLEQYEVQRVLLSNKVCAPYWWRKDTTSAGYVRRTVRRASAWLRKDARASNAAATTSA